MSTDDTSQSKGSDSTTGTPEGEESGGVSDSSDESGRNKSTYVGIALALLVAVVAVAIGGFVLSGGGNADVGPDASFETDQYVLEWEDRHGRSQSHRQLRVTHAGGETVAHSNFDFVVEGNESVWGHDDQVNASRQSPPPELEWRFPFLIELPENYAAAYPEKNAQWESGEPFVLMAYGGLPEGSGEECVVAGWRNEGAQTPANMSASPNCQGGEPFHGLQPGDELLVEWESASGEQSARLYNDTVE
jgi:hypothetical protein